ncbi:hypothetical protein FOCC_FOCC012886 [Frankliniella occidentalis]|nr:hypothetical protein FOCC_FOCC012886 [Frankliniella occidentalis]
MLLAALASAFPADDTAVSEEVAQQLYAEALYAPVCPEVRSSPKLNLPDGAEVGGDGRGDEPVRWMLMPDGRGEAQVAVLSGAQPKDLPTLGDITFLLYTRDNPDRPERRAMNKTCLPTFENFKASRPTAVLIHGFGDNLQDSYMLPLLKDAFLERTDVNVLAVDWGRHAATPWYQTAAQATEAVGVHVAGLLDHMAERQGLSAARTHIVGFSLGAHVAGHTGKNVRSGRLHRITAVCSHRRAYYYYAEALKESARFPAYPCASMEEYRAGKCARVAAAHLGDDADHCTDEGCTQGNFYFETNPSSPFARPEPSSSPTAESV